MTHRVVLVLALIAASLFAACAKSNEWDGVINEYEKLVDQAISLQSRIKAGDTAAATELAALGPKFQETMQKLAPAQGSGLTDAQAKRFAEISQKYQAAMTQPQP